jgi:DNA repair protein RadC
MEQLLLFPHKSRFADVTHTDLTEHEQFDVIRLAREVLAERYRPGTMLTSPDDTKEYLRLHLADQFEEVFAVLFLTQRHHVLAFEILFRGSISGASVHPRVVVRRSIDLNAAAVIVAHNHPSGIAEPSNADQAITRKLKDALALVEVRVTDHLIVCGRDITSFSERGLL